MDARGSSRTDLGQGENLDVYALRAHRKGLNVTGIRGSGNRIDLKCFVEAVGILEKATGMDRNDMNIDDERAQPDRKLDASAKSQEPLQIFPKLDAQERDRKDENLDASRKGLANPNE